MTAFHLFYAFCAGAFGAMMGASGAFILTGCFCAIGMAALLGGAEGAFIHSCVTFGPYLLPAVTFAGGAAAAHYARLRGYVPYGEGRDIQQALIALGKPDVVLFGGLIGMIGYAMSTGMGLLGLGRLTDTSALSITLIALGLKLLCDHTLMGKADGLPRYHPDAPCWQATLTRTFDKTLYGALIAGAAACCVQEVLSSENALFAQYGIFLPFGISCVVLLLTLGGTKAPTTHHITLCTAYAMAAGGSLGWGILAGVLATFAADFLGRTFHMHGDAYVDPAAMAICTVTPLVQWLLPMTGLHQTQVLPFMLLGLWLAGAWVFQYRRKSFGHQTFSRSAH
ncbi:MAG: hypothetical protein IJ418_01110 [Clostridia bacterium]|nr:hypothetical protein [Clostridia bacterium]